MAADAGPDASAMQTVVAVEVEVQFACDASDVPGSDLVEAWVAAAVSASGRAPAGELEVAVRFVTSNEIRALNARYRRQDKVTNVLAFPAGPSRGLPSDVPVHLGDIVVCAAVVVAEAEQQSKPLNDHWAHMLVHGALHLLGFDHGDADEAAEMEVLEAHILAAGGVSDPYASR